MAQMMAEHFLWLWSPALTMSGTLVRICSHTTGEAETEVSLLLAGQITELEVQWETLSQRETGWKDTE